VACPLSSVRSSQGTRSCVLVQVLANRTFQTQINGKKRTLLGVVKELGFVQGSQSFPGESISTGAEQFYS
jgi:hypothetical protein